MKYKRGYYDIFIKTCTRYPTRTAVQVYDNGHYRLYSYSELFGVCEYISQNFKLLNCTQGIVGLVSERNVIIPCAIAAAHKCSTTFMFIDPTQDIKKITVDIKFSLLVAIGEVNSPHTLELVNKHPDKTFTVFGLVLSFYNLNTVEYRPGVKNSNVYSFISMTSGSTGEPKHIQVPLQCIQPNINDLTKLFNITNQDIIYFSTPLTFDPSIIEIMLACLNGACLFIAPEQVEVLFPPNIKHSVTFWQTTPSKFFQHSNEDISQRILKSNSTLKILALGGEPLNGANRLKALKSHSNKTKIFVLYGITEMSCWACVTELDLEKIDGDCEIPLGKCLSETEIAVHTTNDSEDSDVGKIVLLSESRRCVILNKPKGNIGEASLKWIETGDLGEMKNGTVYYRGRTDDVIKRFGHKVNLQSIENAVMQCPRVKSCSCVWLPKPMLLVVYYSSETFKSQELSYFLKCKLDDKHWPDRIIRVNNLPVTRHGKVSKQALATMYETTSEEKVESADNSLKVTFLDELKTVLKDQFTYEDIKNKDFYSIGGTSFMAISMCNRLSAKYPTFGKALLPYLLSQRNSIDEVIDIASKKMETEKGKPKKKLKRTRSTTVQSRASNVSSKKTSLLIPIEFSVLWKYNTGKCVDASPSLHLDGFKLYMTVGSHSGQVCTFEAVTGELTGMIDVKSRVEASVLCYGDPPLGVVGSYNGTIVCYTLEDGMVLWKTNIGCMIKSKALYCNDLIYVAAYDGAIRCMESKSGTITQLIPVCEQPISADLALAKSKYILLGTLSGVCASLHVGTNSIVWRGTLDTPVFANPILYDEDKYVIFTEVNGDIHCRTVEKGIKIWKYQGAKGNIFSSIYIKNINSIKWQMTFGCHDNKVYSILVKNFQPSLMWTAELPSPVYATPCGLNTNLILAAANNGCLAVIDSCNGTILGEYKLPHETFSSPAVQGDYVFIGCRDDNIYALRFVTNM